MGFLDRLKKRPAVDEDAIRRMLVGKGATEEQAHQIVETLGARLAPGEVEDWLMHPERAHGVPDPDSEAKFGATLNWTPINAIAAGRTELVIEEAKRYVSA